MRCHSKLDTAMCLVFPHFAHMPCLSLFPTNNNVSGWGLESGVASALDHHEQSIDQSGGTARWTFGNATEVVPASPF